jgi:hypothetical protein
MKLQDRKILKQDGVILQHKKSDRKKELEMSGKSEKKLRRAVKNLSSDIKIEGLQEFINYIDSQPFKRRFSFLIRRLFKIK